MNGAGRTWAKYFAVLCLFTFVLGDGMPRLLSAPVGYALRFDGLDDRVTFGAAPALGVTTFTLETWFRRDGPGATATTGSGGVVGVPLITKGMAESEGNNKDTNYFFAIDGKRRVLVADFEDTINGGNHPVYGVTPICDGVWYHAAVTWDGTTWRLYLNGVLETQLVAGSFTPRYDSIQQAAIGSALNSSGSAGGAFQGAMDEVRIWNVARSAADIQTSMAGTISNAPGLIGRWGLDEGVGTSTLDSSGSGVTGTVRNGAAWITGSPFAPTPPTPGDYGVHLKGTTAAADYVSVEGTPLGASSFTVETWFKRDGAGVTTTTGTSGLAAVVPLVTKGRNEGEGNATDVNYFLGLSGNALAADFEEGAGATNPGLNHPVIGVTQIQNDVWYHAAVTYNGSAVQLYLNGVLEATALASGPARSDSIAHAAIGTALNSTGTAAGFFAGSLDEVRIWNYARTAAQIASGRDREIAAASGLMGRWSFDECCGAATDSSGQAATGTMYGSSWTWVAGGPVAGAANVAPLPAAGPDQTTVLPATALLNGSVTDDGLSGAAVTAAWSQTSGPGTVTFGNPAALTTTATFPLAGAYVLTLTASDGELTGSDSVSIQVNPGAPNLPPVVNAGSDEVVSTSAPASLAGVVTDDGQPGGDPTTTWSKVSGPGTVTFAQANETVTTATFGTAGTYVLMLTANDGLLASSDTMSVTVTAAAPVNKAIDFGGTNAYVTFGPAPGLGAATFTIEAWFRRDGTGVTTSTGTGGITAVPLVTKGRSESDGSNVDMNYFLGIRSDGVLAADFEEGAGGASPGLNHPVAGATVIQNNVWYHAAATYDGTKWQLFLNGVLERELTVGRPPRARRSGAR
ncbi:MAG: hypothetical protein DMF88_05635 [Acidobacteria bacterium]|nr:MAG: hypothetical protein DMF88_05635 [Acidobacteriota bacterium]